MKSYESGQDQRYSQNGKPLGEQLEKKNRKQEKKKASSNRTGFPHRTLQMPTQNTSPTGSSSFCTQWILNPVGIMCFNRDSPAQSGFTNIEKAKTADWVPRGAQPATPASYVAGEEALVQKKPFKTVHEYQTRPPCSKGPKLCWKLCCYHLEILPVSYKELARSLHWAPQIVQLVYPHFLFVLWIFKGILMTSILLAFFIDYVSLPFILQVTWVGCHRLPKVDI